MVCDLGKDVTFDIRSYCDNYYDTKWIRSMLARRKLDPRGFYVLDDENYFYSLLYHAVAHKKVVSKTYAPILNKLSMQLTGSGFDVINDTSQSIVRLKRFMKYHNYSIMRPNELTITSPFFDEKHAGGHCRLARRRNSAARR